MEIPRYICLRMRWSISSPLDVGPEPDDSEDLRLRKRMLVTVTSLGVIGLSRGLACYLLGEPLSVAIPGFYGVSQALSI